MYWPDDNRARYHYDKHARHHDKNSITTRIIDILYITLASIFLLSIGAIIYYTIFTKQPVGEPHIYTCHWIVATWKNNTMFTFRCDTFIRKNKYFLCNGAFIDDSIVNTRYHCSN